MSQPVTSTQDIQSKKQVSNPDRLILASSILLQLVLALFLGHAYDMRIFMATGYLVGTGQNPYLAQNLGAIFQNATFQGITSFGYPPPWALVLGLIYLCTFKIIPNFLFYNLAIKLPVIAANICLAYLVANLLGKSGVQKGTSRRAWIFMLYNPFLLCFSSAWGQFDSVVALLSLFSLFLLSEGKLTGPAVLLALAVSCKPIALPLIPVVFVYLAGRSLKLTLQYFAVFSASSILFCVVPFFLFKWDPAVIFQHWNAHFSVGGGLSFMTFLETLKQSYQLTGLWWIIGWVWVPALGVAAWALKPGITGFKDLLKKSEALILVFYLCRAWLSEPNIIMILPLVLILTCMNELPPLSLVVLWVLPLIFGFFNTSIAQLFFPSMPGVMEALLKLAVEFDPARFAVRTFVAIIWLAAGWWIVFNCFKKPRKLREEEVPD
jgi:hypothetical protein